MKKEYTGLSYEEMMEAMAEVALANDYELNDEDESMEDFLIPDCSAEIEEFFTEPTESENYIIQQVSNRGSEGDGALMYCTFKIENKETGVIGYLEYEGRYSSWDSSYYDDVYVVQPKEVKIIQYDRID